MGLFRRQIKRKHENCPVISFEALKIKDMGRVGFIKGDLEMCHGLGPVLDEAGIVPVHHTETDLSVPGSGVASHNLSVFPDRDPHAVLRVFFPPD